MFHDRFVCKFYEAITYVKTKPIPLILMLNVGREYNFILFTYTSLPYVPYHDTFIIPTYVQG